MWKSAEEGGVHVKKALECSRTDRRRLVHFVRYPPTYHMSLQLVSSEYYPGIRSKVVYQPRTSRPSVLR